MKLEHTSLQKIEFGNEPYDIFHCLVDVRVSPGGLDINKMKLTDPRNIDQQFREAGCILLLTGEEVNELTKRGDLSSEKMHESLFELAVKEGVIKPD